MSNASEGGRRWGPTQNVLAAAIARRFHLAGRTKVQIADEFGISRFKVARMLEAARANGLVRVEVAVPDPVDDLRCARLRDAYGLRHALVLDEPTAGGVPADELLRLRHRLGHLAADVLSELVTAGETLGLAWGRTVNVMIDAVTTLARCDVVQLCGVYSRMDMRDASVETVRRAAAVSGGIPYPVYAPLVLPDHRTAEALRHQPGVADAFDRFDTVTTAVVAIGAWRLGLSTVYDVLEPKARDAIGRLGVTAEMAGHLFDADGCPLTTVLSHHVLAIATEQLRAVPEVIALAGGAEKAEAIDAALRSGIVTTLITDTRAADRLVDLADLRPVPHPAIDRARPAPASRGL